MYIIESRYVQRDYDTVNASVYTFNSFVTKHLVLKYSFINIFALLKKIQDLLYYQLYIVINLSRDLKLRACLQAYLIAPHKAPCSFCNGYRSICQS